MEQMLKVDKNGLYYYENVYTEDELAEQQEKIDREEAKKRILQKQQSAVQSKPVKAETSHDIAGTRRT